MPINQSDTAALIEALDARGNVMTVVNDEVVGTTPIVAVPKNYELKALKPLLDVYLKAPERIQHNTKHITQESFAAHVNTFKGDNTAIFATSDGLVAYYDYHGKDQPAFLDHQALYAMPNSKEFRRWLTASEDYMSQSQFAEFIEDNALDLVVCDHGEGKDVAIRDIARVLNTKIATPTQIIELARGVSINDNASVKSHYSTQTGEQALEYTSEHKDAAGQRLIVPGLFLISIPVYKDGFAYRIPVQLRYRIENKTAKWMVRLYQPERFLEDAFDHVCATVAEKTGVVVYRGTVQ